MTVTIPSVPTPVPSRADPVNFAARADAYHTALPSIVTAMNSQNVENNSLHNAIVVAKGQVDSAKAAVDAASAAINITANVSSWSAATNYAVGTVVYSTSNYQNYRRIVAGATATDPKDDSVNWKAVGFGPAQIGIEPNKVPVNAYLGSLAYMNADSVNVEGIFDGQIRRRAPVTKTSNFTVGNDEHWIICSGTANITVTLPDVATNTGREIMLKTVAAFSVSSASSNVVPLSGASASTAILASTAGKYATIVSDGSNWIVMQAN